MDIIRKGAAVGLGALLAASLMGFAPVPNSTTHSGFYLFSEDGSQVATHVAGKVYQVAEIPTVKTAHLYDAHPHYRSAIAVLDRKGKVLYFRDMSIPKGVNAFGRYGEVKHSYGSLKALKTRLDRIIERAANHY